MDITMGSKQKNHILDQLFVPRTTTVHLYRILFGLTGAYRGEANFTRLLREFFASTFYIPPILFFNLPAETDTLSLTP